MILGDHGDQVVEGWHAELLVCGAELVLQVGGSALGALCDPLQEIKPA